MALRNYINLLSSGVEYIGDKQLTQFGVTNVEMIRKGSDYLLVEITLKRITSYHVLSTFGPTLTLLIIAIVTRFIEESHFEATIMLAITSMLVMYTLYQSASAALPKTAYLKMIDIWLIFGLVVPFIIFLVLILVEMLNDGENENKDGEDSINTEIEGQTDLTDVPWSNKSIVKIRSAGKLNLNVSRSQAGSELQNDEVTKSKRQTTKRKIKRLAKIIIPALTILFIIGYVIAALTIAFT